MDPMDQFIVSVVASLTANLLSEAAKGPINVVTRLLSKDPGRRAIERVFRRAFQSTFESLAGHLDLDVQKHIRGLLEDFLKRDSVSSALVHLAVEREDLPRTDLEVCFNKLGFDSGSLPISFENFMQSLLESLATALDEELSVSDSPLAQPTNSARIRRILDETISNSNAMNKLLNASETTQAQLAAIEEGQVALSGDVARLSSPQLQGPATLWEQLGTAKRLLGRLNVAGARSILEDLKARHWDPCPNDLKARILSLLARAKELDGAYGEAISSRLQASDLFASERDKHIQQAFAYALQGQAAAAFRVAEELVREAPNTPDGWNIWIQSAPSEMAFDTIEAQVPQSVQDDPDILVAFSVRARMHGLITKAQEYARKALEACPDSPLAHLYLAIALLCKYEGQLPEVMISTGSLAPLQEAEQLLARARELAGTGAPSEFERQVRLRRALALRILGRVSEAVEELATLYRLQPQEPTAVFNYARTLANIAQPDDAVRVLKDYLCHGSSDTASGLLMELHLSARPPAYAEALDVADTALPVPSSDPFPRLMFLHQCLVAARGANKPEMAQRYLAEADKLEEPMRLALQAEHSRLWGDTARAQDLMRRARAAMAKSPSADLCRYIAYLLERGGLHREALDTWRGVVSQDSATRDTYAFLECALKCESYADIISTCRTLRQNGVFALRLYDIELSVLYRVNAISDAISLTQAYLREPFSEDEIAYVRFQLSQLGFMTDRKDLCEEDASKYPRVQHVYPDLGETVVKLLFALGKPKEAISYAYTLYRRFPDKVQSHRAMVAAIAYDSSHALDHPDQAAPGTAIAYEALRGQEKGWIVLEDEEGPDNTRNEFGPEHPLFGNLIGKKVGEVFVLQHGQVQDREAKITRIISKFEYRIVECMQRMPQLFGAESGIELVSLESAVPGEIDLDPILRSLDRQEQNARQIARLYQQQPVPLVLVSQLLGTTVSSAMARLKAELNADVYCCMGTQQEYLHGCRCLSVARAVVLDITSLTTLILADAVELLSALDVRLVTAEGILHELREELRHSESLYRSEATLTKHAGRLALIPVTEKERKNWSARLEQAIKAVERSCEVIPGSVALELTPEVQTRLSKIVPHSIVETLALAQRPEHVLWTDDLRMLGLACAELDRVGRVWTQLVAAERRQSGRYSQSAEAKLTAVMLRLGYVNLRITEPAAILLLQEGHFSPDERGVKVLLDHLAAMTTRPDVALSFAALLLRAGWQGCLADSQKALFSNAILAVLRQHTHGAAMIDALRHGIRTLFGLDVLNAKRCRDYLDAWIASNPL